MIFRGKYSLHTRLKGKKMKHFGSVYNLKKDETLHCKYAPGARELHYSYQNSSAPDRKLPTSLFASCQRISQAAVSCGYTNLVSYAIPRMET